MLVPEDLPGQTHPGLVVVPFPDPASHSPAPNLGLDDSLAPLYLLVVVVQLEVHPVVEVVTRVQQVALVHLQVVAFLLVPLSWYDHDFVLDCLVVVVAMLLLAQADRPVV